MDILITGSSGFLGQYIKTLHQKRGDNLFTIGRSQENDAIIDLTMSEVDLKGKNFNLVIHACGKAHVVPKTENEKSEFYSINVIGTLNLLKSLEGNSKLPKYFIFISTIAVYGLVAGKQIDENFQLNAKDPYGHSKILAERIICEWCNKNNVILTILRLPLVIGINPTGNLKKMIDGIKKGYYMNIDGGKAQKSMVLAEDVANFMPVVMYLGGIYNLTDGQHPNFFNLSKHIANNLGKKKIPNVSKYFAFVLSKFGDIIGANFPINSDKFIKIISDLTFDDSKARSIGWKSTSVLKDFNVL